MAAFVKTKLKAAREAIGKKQYDAARDAASQILEYEPENYNANVFLGLACLELGEHERSEQAYRKAIASSPEQPLAWQGLVKFYEKTEKWDQYAQTLEEQAAIYGKSNDASKLGETLQKLLDLRRERGTREQIILALSLFLSDSPHYHVLSSLPPPDPTNPTSTSTFFAQCAVQDALPLYEEIAALTEKIETETITKEVEKRRTRLGARGPAQLRKEVGVEVWSVSKLPKLYEEIINQASTSDELRRATEAKLLRHKQQYLFALSASSKAEEKSRLAAEVQSMADGAVLLGIPDELAWSIYIESRDADSIAGYDLTTLRRYITTFPLSPLSRLLRGYFIYYGLQYRDFKQADEKDSSTSAQTETEEDGYDLVVEAVASLPDSVIAHHVLAEVQHTESDFANAMQAAESGLEVVRRTESAYGKKMPLAQKAFNVVLGVALVHYYPPKHHQRALGVLDEVLSQDPDNIPCLMGRGYIMQQSTDWTKASEHFAHVGSLISDDLENGLRAREEHAWCLLNLNQLDLAAEELERVLGELQNQERRDNDQARCFWRLGRCRWQMGGDAREQAYRHFITSLKHSPTFAPAFTALGIYYAEGTATPDPTRASKCFQKAFELDAREAEAARRLAEGFANEREWDLVEVVTRRTIEGEGGLTGGLDSNDRVAAAKYLPTNGWAWKALGVVELTHRNYPAAITALQTALRAHPDDELCWLRLGEAYSKAGRLAAAVKALGRAQELKPDDWICLYLLADVQRQTGLYQEAAEAFQTILEKRPGEIGVMMALAETWLELGEMEAASGFVDRAEMSFLEAISTALSVVEAAEGFRHLAWKLIGDGLVHLASRPVVREEELVLSIVGQIPPVLDGKTSERVAEILAPGWGRSEGPLRDLQLLETAMAAYDYRLSLGTLDNAVAGSASHDLAVTTYTWASRLKPGELQEKAFGKAILHVMEAVRSDPGNDRFWDTLGCMNFGGKPRAAQHAFIKALEIDDKNPATWSHLGLLYLRHEDLKLANEALYRAQTLDPDYALAWVGQGLVATANGHHLDAKALFEHVVTSLPADVSSADLEFSSRLFSELSKPTRDSARSASAFIPAFFALDRYCKRRPNDASALHLFGLICERMGHLELGLDLVQRAITILEAVYEETEDPAIERQFIVANASMGRLRLAVGNYSEALESFSSAQGLLPEDADDASVAILRAQCQFGSGLASFSMGALHEALALFEGALESAGDNSTLRGQVTVLLAQALWALGSPEGQETAKNRLLQCIADDPENLGAINALAGMGIVSQDSGLVDAALSEILSLPLERRRELDPGRDVSYLLTQHRLSQNDANGALAMAQEALFAEPSQTELRRGVARLALQQGQNATAVLGLISGSGREEEDPGETRESIAMRAIAVSDSGGDGQREGQKAVILAPWDKRNWEALAYVRSVG